MKKDFYYLKEILLGLKDEYVKMDEELKKLKQLAIVTNPDKIKDFYFWLYQFENKGIELKCLVEKEKNILKRFIEELQKKTGTYVYGRNIRTCNINENGTFVIKDKDGSILGTTPEFGLQTKKILSSDFANNIYKERIFASDGSLNPLIEINHSFIKYLHSMHDDYISLDYKPAKSTISIDACDKTCNEEKMLDILYSKFLRSDFSKYHQRVIDENSSSFKPIEILDIPTQLSKTGYLSETMELEEQESVVVLKKKRNN